MSVLSRSAPAVVTPQPADNQAGARRLRQLTIAMLFAGLAGFALLYAPQALLPDISATFGVSATMASLTVSFATGALALSVLPMSHLADRVGRPRMMTISLSVATLTVAAAAFAPALWIMLVLRALDGVALAGVIAVAMSHIGAEFPPHRAATAIGIYVSGTSLGGLAGRLIPAGAREFVSWRWSIFVLAVVAACCALAFALLIPAPRAARSPAHVRAPRPAAVLANGDIRRLCGVAFAMMGGFVAVYNYLTYRLTEQPFHLRPAVIGFVFTAYLAGTLSSSLAARLCLRLPRRTVVLAAIAVSLAGLMTTLADNLAAVLCGLVVYTAGFFAVHGVVSGWTATVLPTARTTASALYVMAYYLGSSIGGALIGLAWSSGRWPATVACVAVCCVVAALLVPRTSNPSAGAKNSPTRG